MSRSKRDPTLPKGFRPLPAHVSQVQFGEHVEPTGRERAREEAKYAAIGRNSLRSRLAQGRPAAMLGRDEDFDDDDPWAPRNQRVDRRA